TSYAFAGYCLPRHRDNCWHPGNRANNEAIYSCIPSAAKLIAIHYIAGYTRGDSRIKFSGYTRSLPRGLHAHGVPETCGGAGRLSVPPRSRAPAGGGGGG